MAWTTDELEKPNCAICGEPLEPIAYMISGEGWWLYWDCPIHAGDLDYSKLEIAWPFGTEEKYFAEMREAGFVCH